MKLSVALAAFAISSFPTFAQKMQTPVGEAPGPWLLGTIGVGKQPDGTVKTTALKGLAIKVAEHGEAAVCYDLDLCRMAGAWTGGKFTTPMNLMSRGEYPMALGAMAFTTDEVAGFQTEFDLKRARNPAPPRDPHGRGIELWRAEISTTRERLKFEQTEALQRQLAEQEQTLRALLDAVPRWIDPRPEPFGPLPPERVRFNGFHVIGDKVILRWKIRGTEVLEMPEFVSREGVSFVRRHFEVGVNRVSFKVILRTDLRDLGGIDGESAPGESLGASVSDIRGKTAGLTATSAEGQSEFSGPRDGELALVVKPSTVTQRFRVDFFDGPDADTGRFAMASDRSEPFPDLRAMTTGATARWPESAVTRGELANDTTSAYVVDTIKLPDPNPWNAPMFIGGFDFFPDGRAAVCTFHGDVFLISGIDEKLERVTWKRFASGLYHALGLKIVKGEIFVACRDGLWRLNDINKDGECDFYEAFNFDLKVTKNFHEFVFDLQTDAKGNFYFTKAGPVKNGGRGFDEIMSQHGTLMRVSPDGKKLDVLATGLRAPNGIGVGPRGELTSGDNEGTWTPACKINWIKPGGFYGCVPLAHGIDGESDLSTLNAQPSTFPRPLCWLPKRVDNSGGSQVWVPDDDRWGPWRGQMLHLSYGQAALFGVLAEPIYNSEFKILNSEMQGGVTKFPLRFESGIMRARFNPKDGQLYVAGLRGWQTNGLKNGCFQRVRFTGAVPRMPIEMHVKKHGIELRFACSLDTQSASDPENWHLEQWRYLWSDGYGSPELSTEGDVATAEKKHDPVLVKSVSIGTDDRSVFLELPALKPVMQMSIRYDLKTADGEELRGEVVNTIHALGAE